MEFKVQYKVKNKFESPELCDCALNGGIGRRADTFFYERVGGRFAIDEILRESEIELKERYDDQFGQNSNCLWRSEFWGKLMISAVRVCALKQDEALKEEIRKSVYRVLSYQDDDGYLCTYKNKDWIAFENKNYFNWNVWGRKYILWALIEAAMLLDDKNVLSCAEKLAKHLIGQFKEQGISVREAGVTSGLPASSIIKPMLVLYRLTGDKEYFDFTEAIVKDLDREDGAKPNIIRNALSGVAPRHWYDDDPMWTAKAYEMMSCFDGLIEYYRITGEERVIQATKAFWELLVEHESNILGSVGYNEHFHNARFYPDSSTEVCDVLHWMRLCYELYKLYGEAKYMDNFERAFLNAFLAGVNENGKGGAFFVRSSGRHWAANWQCGTKYQHCCLNNVPRGFTNAAESGVFKGEDGYYFNTYYPTQAHFGDKEFITYDGYCTTGVVMIKVRNLDEGTKIHFRIPSWSNKTVITYGEAGTEHEVISAAPGEYAVFTAEKGDVSFRIIFDMTPRIYDFPYEFRRLDDSDYHVRRWCDTYGGFCDREVMVKHPMSCVFRGPLTLARSKRIGCSESEMFNGKTVHGTNAICSIRLATAIDTLLFAGYADFKVGDRTFTYRMCDYASACNFNSEDERFFTVHI